MESRRLMNLQLLEGGAGSAARVPLESAVGRSSSISLSDCWPIQIAAPLCSCRNRLECDFYAEASCSFAGFCERQLSARLSSCAPTICPPPRQVARRDLLTCARALRVKLTGAPGATRGAARELRLMNGRRRAQFVRGCGRLLAVECCLLARRPTASSCQRDGRRRWRVQRASLARATRPRYQNARHVAAQSDARRYVQVQPTGSFHTSFLPQKAKQFAPQFGARALFALIQIYRGDLLELAQVESRRKEGIDIHWRGGGGGTFARCMINGRRARQTPPSPRLKSAPPNRFKFESTRFGSVLFGWPRQGGQTN